MTHKCTGDAPEFIRRTLKIVGDKYSALMLRHLHEGPQRFSDFEQNIDMSPRTLSQRLDMLLEEGVIEKRAIADSNRYEYALTQAGIDLDEVIHTMAKWGQKHERS